MKIPALFIACFLIASCGSDESFITVDPVQQALTGKWKLQSILRNGAPYTLEQCADQNTLDFKDTGAFIQLDYGMPTGYTTCVIDSLTTGSFTVENDSIFFSLNARDTLYKAAVLQADATLLRLNSRMYYPQEQEGTDEVTFTKVN